MRATRLLVGVAVVTLLGACSSGTSSPPPASPTPTPTATATPEPSQDASAPASSAPLVNVTAFSLRGDSGFAIDPAGDIYTPGATDGYALVKLAPDGTVLARWAGTDVVAGEPDVIVDVVLDPASGDVFALDTTADLVVHLSGELEVLDTFGAPGNGPGELTNPGAIALDPSGQLLVVDTGNNRIETFTRDGTFVSTWDAPGGAMWPFGLAVDRQGNLVVSGGQPYDQTTNTAGWVIVFAPDHAPLVTLKFALGWPLFFPDAAVDAAGNTLVLDGSGEILTYSPTGTLVTRWTVWPRPSPDTVQVAPSGAVRVAPSGQVYASGCVGIQCRIVELDRTGAALRTWDFTGPVSHPGTKVATGQGYGLYLQCAGTGSPTVVWESGSGMGGSADLPAYLLGRLAAITHVCLYDRAGLSLSDNAPYDANAGGAQMIADLHAVLQEAGVPGPYVMAGYSLGGLLTRLYAATYPKEVVGMVQVDGLSEDFLSDVSCIDARCPWYSTATALRDAIPDGIPGSLGSLPLVVITHDPAFPPWGASLDPPWQETQQALATASSNAVHVDASWSSHLITGAQPGLVIEAVRQVVAAARSADHALPPCGGAFAKPGGKCL